MSDINENRDVSLDVESPNSMEVLDPHIDAFVNAVCDEYEGIFVFFFKLLFVLFALKDFCLFSSLCCCC